MMDVSWRGEYLFELEVFIFSDSDVVKWYSRSLTYLLLQVRYCDQIPGQLELHFLKDMELNFVISQAHLPPVDNNRPFRRKALF